MQLYSQSIPALRHCLLPGLVSTKSGIETLPHLWDAEMHAMDCWQARRRSLGNIQLIGHLYRQGLVSESIMHCCILQFLVSRCCHLPASLCAHSAAEIACSVY